MTTDAKEKAQKAAMRTQIRMQLTTETLQLNNLKTSKTALEEKIRNSDKKYSSF